MIFKPDLDVSIFFSFVEFVNLTLKASIGFMTNVTISLDNIAEDKVANVGDIFSINIFLWYS